MGHLTTIKLKSRESAGSDELFLKNEYHCQPGHSGEYPCVYSDK